MAFWNPNPDKSRGSSLIRRELNERRSLLSAREDELATARKHVAELEATCARLREHVAELEHDQHALDRGYIAIMCDRASALGA